MLNIRGYSQLLEQHQIQFAYKGEIDSEVVGYIIRMVEHKLVLEKEPLLVRKKIVNILIESLQNIVNYFSEEAIDKSFVSESFVLIQKNEETYQIYTSNYLSKQKTLSLKKRLDNVNMMDDDSLRDVYVQILETPKKSSGNGAGLGFIDIVRKSKHKITYDFSEHSSDLDVFAMKILVERKKLVAFY
jgi:hypothetical protein